MDHPFATAALSYAPLIGVAPLMRRAFNNEDLRPLGLALLERAQRKADDANAYLDCSVLLQLIGDREIGLAMQAQALAIRNQYALPCAREAGLRLLVLMGLGDLMANTPIEFLLEDGDVALELLYLTPDRPWPEVVPDHDVMLVAIAESDANQVLLQRLASFVAEWPRPVLNLPGAIAGLTRDGVCAALRGVPGLAMPPTARVARADLASIARSGAAPAAVLAGAAYPVIVRPIGSHAGQHLDKIEDSAALAAYLERVDAAEFYISPFVDYRGADGRFRKFRLALIGGAPYICHFAVAEHWMIHYLNAGMNEDAGKRAEEAAQMAGFDEDFARRHGAALREIDRRMGLDYLGIDCAETREGELLIFEVDNAMIVHAMDPPALFPYKRPAMDKVFAAFRALLERARTQAPPGQG